MIQTKEKTINGATYSVTQLPARRAIKLKAKLLKLFGPVLAQVFIFATDSKTDSLANENLIKGFEVLSAHIDENSFESLVTELLTGVRKDGLELTPAIIDLEFAGDMASLYLVLWFILEVNYSNFFSLIGIGNQSTTDQSAILDTKKTYIRK